MHQPSTHTPRQLPLFVPERLAHKPYCTDDLESGLRIRPSKTALHRAYIQANSPGKQFRIVVDVDRDIRQTAETGEWHGDYGVPMPNWTAISPGAGRAHVAYEIEVPVAKHEFARSAPLRFAAAIEGGLTRKLQGDPGYSGLICKNPLHPNWRTVPGRAQAYDLAELADWVDLVNPGKRQVVQAEGCLGRNCMLFDQLRQWAYTHFHPFRRDKSFCDWLAAVEAQACECNHFHGTALPRTDPLAWAELRRIAKSVATWTWKNFGSGKAHANFAETQRLRAAQSAASKRARTEARIRDAQADLLSRGRSVTMRAVAKIIGMSASGLSQHYGHLFDANK